MGALIVLVLVLEVLVLVLVDIHMYIFDMLILFSRLKTKKCDGILDSSFGVGSLVCFRKWFLNWPGGRPIRMRMVLVIAIVIAISLAGGLLALALVKLSLPPFGRTIPFAYRQGFSCEEINTLTQRGAEAQEPRLASFARTKACVGIFVTF